MDAERRVERAARALLRVVDERDPGLRGYYIDAERFNALRAALDAAPEPAQEPVDALCLFCRTELDLDEMDDGSDLPPLAPGVCSECFQRWHDEPVWRKRLKEATYPPAPDAALLERVAREAVRLLLLDLADRRDGFDVRSFDEDVQAEIREAHEAIVARAIAAAKGCAR